MSGRVETISFKSKHRKQEERKHRREKTLAQQHLIRAARLLALAHHIQNRIENGDFKDYAEVTRHHQLTRARLTQIMNLLTFRLSVPARCRQVQTGTGRPPCLQTKVIILTHLWILTQLLSTNTADGTIPTLGDIVGAFKSITTDHYINGVKQNGWPPFPCKLRQRNYHEHITNNPANWEHDKKTNAVNLAAAIKNNFEEWGGVRAWEEQPLGKPCSL